jgi:hypothetical protein
MVTIAPQTNITIHHIKPTTKRAFKSPFFEVKNRDKIQVKA